MILRPPEPPKPKKLYIDSETCSLHSIMVLLQYAVEDGPVTLHHVWKRPVGETLDLIEWMLTHTVVAFNLVFDWFHLAKIYTIWRLLPRDWIPEEHIENIAMLEAEGQEGPAIKPAGALDLLLYSRKGPMQSLMQREPVRLRRVPAMLSDALKDELEKRIEIDGIYFAGAAAEDAPRWHSYDIKKLDGHIDQHFKDVCLRFSPKGGLKFLVEYLAGYKPKYHIDDVEPEQWAKDFGYAPTALARSTPELGWAIYKTDKKGNDYVWGYAWPGVIRDHIKHWYERKDAQEYASLDIEYIQWLDKYFGYPEINDDDSILACMVAVLRWRGYRIDREGIQELMAKAQAVIDSSPVNVNRVAEVRRYLGECMDDIEKKIIEETTRKAKLTAITDWDIGDTHEDIEQEMELLGLEAWDTNQGEACLKCRNTGKHEGHECPRCGGKGFCEKGRHPAAERATLLLKIKAAVKEKEIYEKLLLAGKFHADFNIIGALSSRMSGASGLNAQGIKHTKEVRKMFPLAWDGYTLCGGDFDSFEVTIADAVYNDEGIRKILLSGQKIHAYYAMYMYPTKSDGSPMTYEDIMASEGTDFDMYGRGKSGVFGMIYGGDWSTLVRNFGISREIAENAERQFLIQFPGIARARQRIYDQFCSMRQPDGIGSKVIWKDPEEYVDNGLGFKRYFTLENKICKALYELAQKPPKHWKECKAKVVRRDRVQVASGAVQSALFCAAFQMQAANMRAAANHEIQSRGAIITKTVQRKIWDLQPVGVHDLKVMPLNVHDEIMCPCREEYIEPVVEVVREAVESYRWSVPLIGMTWFKKLGSWAGKKGDKAEGEVKICPPEMAHL